MANDTFNDVNGTLLASHISDSGDTWSLFSVGGSATINTVFGPNVPAARAIGSSQLWQWSAAAADGELEAIMHNLGGGGTPRGGLFFRALSNSSYWQVLLEGTGPDSTLRLQAVGGGSTNLTVTIVGKLEGTMRVEFSGSRIEVFFDGVSQIIATDSFNVTETGLGLAVGNTGSGGTTTEWSNITFGAVGAGMVTVTERTEPVDFLQLTIRNLFVLQDVHIVGDLQVDGATTGIDVDIGATITSGTVGSILFVGTGPVLAQDNSGLFWDDTNKRLGVGTASPDVRLHAEVDDAVNSAVTQLLRLAHTTSGAPAAGIGVGMEFEVETAAGNNEIGATIEAVTTDVGAGTEDFDLVFRTMAAGAAAAERMRISSLGLLTLTGGLSVGGDAFITDGNALVVGHTAQLTTSNTGAFQVLGTAGDDTTFIFGRFSADQTGTGIHFVKSRSGTIGTSAIVQDNDRIGALVYFPADGVNFATQAAQFRAEVDDPSPAVGDIGAAFVWSQMPGGGVALTETMRLAANGTLFIGDDANANMTVGLTINQGANDDEILALKSSDVAHGMTAETETDTWFIFDKLDPALGGAALWSWSESTRGFEILSRITTDTTTKLTTSRAAINMRSDLRSGTGVGVHAATANVFAISPSGTTRFIVDASGNVYQVGDTIHFINESANANMTVGLTINQGAASNEAIALKCGSVAHGFTARTETDTYGTMQVRTLTTGGLRIASFRENEASGINFQLFVSGGQANTLKTTGGFGLVDLLVEQHNGANAVANITADGNVFSIRAQVGGGALTRFMVDEDGDLFVVAVTDVAAAGPQNLANAAAFDGEDDAQLVRAFETARNGEGLIRTEFDDYVRYNEDDLVRFGILGAPVAEGGMWNLTQHTRLLNGAIWQLYTRLERMSQELAEANRSILALKGG